ncbi:MAG: hypothetical protein ACRC2S_05275 [Waterburya sp.]
MKIYVNFFNLFLINENIAWCQFVTIQSIQVKDQSVDEIEVTDEVEIGLKFDVNTKSGLDLYILL